MRTSAPDLPVAPAARCRRSSSRTFRAPMVARLNAVLVPLAPPPMMTMSAVALMEGDSVMFEGSSPGPAPLTGWGETPINDGPRAASVVRRVSDEDLGRMIRGGSQHMELTRRDLLKGAAALGAAAAVDVTARGGALAQTTQKKELVTAQSGDISKFDPHFSTSSNDIRVSFNIFDNLTSRHPDGKLHPGLATEWKLDGQTTWRFKLRPGVKFHNGDPFTSADAKWSIERTYDPNVKTMVATVLTTIDRIEAPDPYTLLIQ